MKLSKKHSFVLYALTLYLKKVNKRFSDEPLEASISKIDFIRLMQKLKIIDKSERGIYRNLELLEKKKLIKYENRFLKLTEKGFNAVQEKENELLPYFELITILEKGKCDAAKTLQTYFR